MAISKDAHGRRQVLGSFPFFPVSFQKEKRVPPYGERQRIHTRPRRGHHRRDDHHCRDDERVVVAARLVGAGVLPFVRSRRPKKRRTSVGTAPGDCGPGTRCCVNPGG